jgi:hypothetical protein
MNIDRSKNFRVNVAVLLFVCIDAVTRALFAQVFSETNNGWVVDQTIKAFENGKEAGRYGDTNFPLISIQWFPMRGIVQHISLWPQVEFGRAFMTQELGSQLCFAKSVMLNIGVVEIVHF